KDELLAPKFAQRIDSDDWPRHLNRMYDFWNTILFYDRSYSGNPFSKHVGLGAEPMHFERWKTLFTTTIDEHFQGIIADEAKSRAEKMAALFSSKLQYMRDNPGFKTIV
ncbi:MAG: group III truncated hemoglobin, partial [Saprospiraceae bacterium]